jgi:MSHA biogenesis protein MshP
MIVKLRPFSGRPRQGGVSLIAAVFLLVLLSLLAAAMASILSSSQINLAADIGGSQAYQAARAGVEWGMYQLDPNGTGSGLPACPSSTTLTAIPGHSVDVSCSASVTYTEGNRSLKVFRIVAVARATGAKAPGIERQVEATIEKCRSSVIVAAPYDC